MQDSLLPEVSYGLTKKEIKDLAKQTVLAIQDGDISGRDVLKLAEQISAVDEFISSIKDDVVFKKSVRDELDKYPSAEGFISPSGAILIKMEAGVKYDYSGDAIWKEYKFMADKANELLKEREAFLKSIPTGQSIVDQETGELTYAPVKTSTSTYKVSLKSKKE